MGVDRTGDLWIEDGRLVESPCGDRSAFREVDARGLTAVPGFIDLHVHFREPGNLRAETVYSGMRAAAAGGFATVVVMPNTQPPRDTPERVLEAVDMAVRIGGVEMLPSGCLTRGRKGVEPADWAGMVQAGAAALSDDGTTVVDDALMERAMAAAAAMGVPVMDHALDPRLAGAGVMYDGDACRRLGFVGMPREAEVRMVKRDIRLAEKTRCRMHVQHISVAESVDCIREARRRGVSVTAEVTPHHLALCDADVDGDAARFKMNPPLGSKADRDALREGVVNGTIGMLATDHAPHRAADKASGFVNAPFGVIGMETAIGVTHTLLVASGRMPLSEWVRRWTAGPAGVLGRAAPTLGHGAPANVVLLDLGTPWTVDANRFQSLSRNTPFEGWKLTGVARMTLCRGRLAWEGSER
jgi:dihydroorotase